MSASVCFWAEVNFPLGILVFSNSTGLVKVYFLEQIMRRVFEDCEALDSSGDERRTELAVAQAEQLHMVKAIKYVVEQKSYLLIRETVLGFLAALKLLVEVLFWVRQIDPQLEHS